MKRRFDEEPDKPPFPDGFRPVAQRGRHDAPSARNGRDSENLSHHILPNSAAMVGVCMVVISIVKSPHPDLAGYVIDKLLAIDSVLFLFSALLSFFSIRTPGPSETLERWAEIVFLLALSSMTVVAVIFSFEIV